MVLSDHSHNFVRLHYIFPWQQRMFYWMVWFMVFNAIFNNISVISWRSVLLVEEIGVPLENHRPVASHRQTLSHIVGRCIRVCFVVKLLLFSLLHFLSFFFFFFPLFSCQFWKIVLPHTGSIQKTYIPLSDPPLKIVPPPACRSTRLLLKHAP